MALPTDNITPLQRTVITTLYAGGTIRKHRNAKDEYCYRLIDVEYKPIQNFTQHSFNCMLNRGIVIDKGEGLGYALNPAIKVLQSKILCAEDYAQHISPPPLKNHNTANSL